MKARKNGAFMRVLMTCASAKHASLRRRGPAGGPGRRGDGRLGRRPSGARCQPWRPGPPGSTGSRTSRRDVRTMRTTRPTGEVGSRPERRDVQEVGVESAHLSCQYVHEEPVDGQLGPAQVREAVARQNAGSVASTATADAVRQLLGSSRAWSPNTSPRPSTTDGATSPRASRCEWQHGPLRSGAGCRSGRPSGIRPRLASSGDAASRPATRPGCRRAETRTAADRSTSGRTAIGRRPAERWRRSTVDLTQRPDLDAGGGHVEEVRVWLRSWRALAHGRGRMASRGER